MRGSINLAALALAAVVCAGCSMQGFWGHGSGYSVEFIAGNSNSVLIDFAHGSDQELDAARALAVNRCALFGGTIATLDSVNPRSGGRDRASFLCR